MKILLANFTKMVNDSGGVAKVTCSFANEMIKRGHEVSLIYSDEKEGDFFFPIDKNVRCYDLRHYNGKSIDFPLYMKIKRELLRSISKRKVKTVNNDFINKYLLDNLKDILRKIEADVIVTFQPAATKSCCLILTYLRRLLLCLMVIRKIISIIILKKKLQL